MQAILKAPASMSSTVSLTVPATATNAVLAPGDFVGFGFETAFVNDYANDFSNKLMNSVAKRLPETLTIRTGGTSGDMLTYDPGQAAVKVCVSGDCPIGSSAAYILGPAYFDGFASFQDFHLSVQAPLGPTVNLSNTLAYVELALDQVGDRLAAIAIGNEPNLYPAEFGVSYSIEQYVADVELVRANLTDALGLNETIFELLDISDFAETDSTTKFTIINTFERGIDSTDNAKFAATHFYQIKTETSTLAQMQTDLMNHAVIVSNISAGVPQDVAYLAANYPAVQYIFSETGSGLTTPREIQDSFGAALWFVDFQLYSLVSGVARVDGTQRPAANHSLWVPDDSAGDVNPGPQVRAPFYAQPFVADFIGLAPGNVLEIDLASDYLVAYASYNASTGAAEKLALINFIAWADGISTASRGSVSFAVSASGLRDTVRVRRLRAEAGCQAMGYDYAGPEQNITWAGEQWSYSLDGGEGHLVANVNVSEVVDVTDGQFTVQVLDSEAILVDLI
ncbi:hypothetical protein ASPZODRAFT_29260 [Penicilliopsis zonata CBS 506.65]|uniref:Beta-glucuronidase C-terminal domain-containing protein n=1 Tax=Penicilliopsis zonata CBS 506.65 TaxID=1073090 RepID=A0A1L9S5I1_9EURO|nr:hypothetical protein ASPZODRAFT_29260 [Penicilliopsis zonata CBS 506.65]OJJ42418.1 hypothetical protein ASPZODRAFT_29260 [Penicilliopsis zonata CBS 506.65]